MPGDGRFARFLRRLAGLALRRYEPARHYMRGPGPATRTRLSREARRAAPAVDPRPPERGEP